MLFMRKIKAKVSMTKKEKSSSITEAYFSSELIQKPNLEKGPLVSCYY